MSLFDKLFRDKGLDEIEPKMDVVYVERSNDLVDLSVKENRADSVNYQGIGRTKYASGLPPTELYTGPLNAWNNYPIVASCINAMADAISSLSVKVYKVRGGEFVEDSRHEFHEIYRNPNPYQSSQEFVEEISKNLNLFGNAFISIEKASPLELYVLPATQMAVIPDAKTKVKEYRFYINGVQQVYKPEEIIHIRITNPEDPYLGLPPLSVAKKILALEGNRIDFATNFFKNHAVPIGVLETDSTVSETILQKLRGEWTRLYTGMTRVGATAILQGGLKFRSISSPLKDLDFKSLKELSNSDILSIYRTPAIVLGDLAESSGEEGKAAVTAWWRNAVIPHLKRIETAINRGLKDVVFGGGKARFEFNLKDVAALQDDKESLSKYLSQLVSSSIMTGNEARAIVGLPKSTEQYMDVPLVSNSFFGSQNMPVSEVTNQGAGSNEEKPAVKPKKDLDHAAYSVVKKLESLNKYLKSMDV